MRKLLLFLAVVLITTLQIKGQPVSSMPTFTGNTTGAYMPIIIPVSSTFSNRKFPMDSLAYLKNIRDTSAVLRALIGSVGFDTTTLNLSARFAAKQNTLTAGTNITIVGNTISAAGGGSSFKLLNSQGSATASGVGVLFLNGNYIGNYANNEQIISLLAAKGITVTDGGSFGAFNYTGAQPSGIIAENYPAGEYIFMKGNLPKTNTLMPFVKANTQKFKMAFIGNSITEPGEFRTELQAKINATYNCNGRGNGIYGRLTDQTATWTTGQSYGINSFGRVSTGTGSYIFDLGGSGSQFSKCTELIVIYKRQIGGGSFTLNVTYNGTSATSPTISTEGTGYGWYKFSGFTDFWHVYQLDVVSQGTKGVAIVDYIFQRNIVGLQIDNWGHSGFTLENQNDVLADPDIKSLMTYLDYDLVNIELGINNSTEDTSWVAAKYQKLIDLVKGALPNTELVLTGIPLWELGVGPYTTVTDAYKLSLTNMVKGLAVRNRSAMLDVYKLFGPYNSNALGYYGPDHFHWATPGYTAIAQAYKDEIFK